MSGVPLTIRDPASILMPVEMISRSFIEESQSDDLGETLAWSAGIITTSIPLTENDLHRAGLPVLNPVSSLDYSPSNSGGAWGHLGRNKDNSVAIRGFTNPTQQRLGFRVGASYGDGRSIGTLVDSVNVDHIRVYRGPASLLFGQNTLSGVIEIVPKRPLAHQAGWIRASAGSYGYRRIEADLTGPILDTMNYRFTAASQDEGDWTQWRGSERSYLAAQLELPIRDNFNVLFEYQIMDERDVGIGPLSAYDVANSDLSLAQDGPDFDEPVNWARALSGEGPDFRWSGPDTYFDRFSENFLGIIDLRLLENLNLNISSSYANTDTSERNLEIETILLTPFAARFYPESRHVGGNFYRMLNGSFYDYSLSVENLQLQAELTWQYSFSGTKHLVTAGRSYLEDNIRESGVTPDIGQLNKGTLKSIDDPSPFHYSASSRYKDQILNLYYGAQMVQDDTFWTLNDFVLYRGEFFNDCLQLFLGSRWERFHARELRRSRDSERDLVVYEARREIGPLRDDRGYRYGGEPQRLSSSNGGMGIRLNERLTFYGLITEGYNPNQGQVDGMGQAIGEERTRGTELGLMFDLLDGRLTGWIGGYEIKRENAVWSVWLNTPAPATWTRTGQVSPGLPARFVPFDVVAAENGAAPLSYGIRHDYLSPDQLLHDEAGNYLNPAILGESNGYVYVDYSRIDAGGLREPMEAAFFAEDPAAFTYDPAWVNGQVLGNNPDAIILPEDRYYANVPFNEKVNGIDLQITFTPTHNWQIELKYAYNEREVSGMQIEDYVDPETGYNWGTEYNQQARQVGRDSFEDPTRPSSIRSGLLLGEDFGVTPRQLLTIWNRYQFDQSFLPGLTLGLGLRYTASQPTSVAVGGEFMERNPYPTPDVLPYWLVDFSIGYKRVFRNTQFKLQVTLYNLFDTDQLVSTSTFPGANTNPVRRRYVQQVAPLSIRISAGLAF